MEAIFVLPDECPEFILGDVFPVCHPMEGDYWFVELLNFFGQLLLQFFPLLPVPAQHRVHIQGGGVVKINRKVLFKRLRFDL